MDKELEDLIARSKEMSDEEFFAALRQLIDARNLESYPLGTADLVNKAAKLVDLMIDVERNHGGLWGPKTLRARDELALELHKWPK